ncbi:UDP-glucose dehydrogenase family protein [Paenibacillus abyssi]|uniref:UDP-glucose 6-dehydrogenase n=1 Tax=Paenibacillus abyssi TaxID=1340531 RepID=A0A917CMM9_9BACL|nr:UDP-glucose/GDP-mannose dehydrogenase family protein [Paenibacillus abyssi]GGF92255.1 UDP-glucose 6-dehydrogenase TuaD [Paenibacillus abyssi]
MNIAVIGTGYVGLTSGVCFAELGNQVICADIDEDKVNRLNQGIIPIYEPGLSELVVKNKCLNRIVFTTDAHYAIIQSDVIIIAVGTPSLPDGNVDLSGVHAVAKAIGQSINSYKVIVNKSTVPVGTADEVKRIIKQNMTDKSIEFDVASVPEFLKEGSAIEDFFHTDRVIIGIDSPRAEQILQELHKPLKTTVQTTDIRSAELIKYASNSFLAMKISFINEIANIAELVGADINEIAAGVGLDTRIGSKFLKAGIGFGGACFPKDTKGLLKIAENKGITFKLLQEVINVNKNQYQKVISKLEEAVDDLNAATIAMLGISFKPNTDDIREAPSLNIIKKLIAKYPAMKLKVYDPAAMELARKVLGDSVSYCQSIEEAVTKSDAMMIVTEWEEIVSFGLEKYKELLKRPIIVDGRNCFIPDEAEQLGISYYSIGRISGVTQ